MDGVYDGKESGMAETGTSILSALYSHAERLDQDKPKIRKIIIPGLCNPGVQVMENSETRLLPSSL